MAKKNGRKSKGDILLAVLERLAEGTGEAAELFMAFVEAGYGASQGRVQYVMRENRREAARAGSAAQEAQRARQRYRILLSALKSDGLIQERPSKLGRAFAITRRGVEKLTMLRRRKKDALPPTTYGTEKSDVVTIVTFDVPERERRKRAWLREVLRHLDFTMVQKSVWMGKAKIPRAFLADIRRLHLPEFVEIFQITKTGSLRHLA